VKLDKSCLFRNVFSAADSNIFVVLYRSVHLEGRFVQDLLGRQRIDEDDDWWEVFAVWRHDARITGQILNFVCFFFAFTQCRRLAVMKIEIGEAISMEEMWK